MSQKKLETEPGHRLARISLSNWPMFLLTGLGFWILSIFIEAQPDSWTLDSVSVAEAFATALILIGIGLAAIHSRMLGKLATDVAAALSRLDSNQSNSDEAERPATTHDLRQTVENLVETKQTLTEESRQIKVALNEKLEEIEFLKERLKLIEKTSSDFYIVFDRSGNILSLSSNKESLVIRQDAEIYGSSIRQLVPKIFCRIPGDNRTYVTLNDGKIVGLGTMNAELIDKYKRVIPVSLTISPFNNDELFLATVSDKTSTLKSEIKLEAYRKHLAELVDEQTRDLIDEKNVATRSENTMSSFLANMSHELRTPLHGILSYANFGIKRIDTVDKEKLLNYFNEIKDSGNYLLDLVNNLLDLSKLRENKMSYNFDRVDINEILLKVVSELKAFAEERDVDVFVEKLTKPAICVVDKAKISQVVRNLLSNAIRYGTNQNNKNSIEIKIDRSAHSKGISILFLDRGIGVPEDEQDKIFNSFSQSTLTRSKTGGTGLGLAICKEIIENGHQGSISCQSRPGGGSIFQISIPDNQFTDNVIPLTGTGH